MQKKSEAFPKKIYLRPALEERMAQILAVPLTVAAAPFGYGKTTAVKKVLLSLSVDMLWDTCYSGAEAAFWRCFVKSLQTVGVDTASLTWQELPRNAATRQRVIEVLQVSKLKKTVVFVWNNYHLLGSEDCDKLLLALAKADLPGWHFVLLTQRPPDFTNEAYFKGKLQIREHLRENFTDEKHFIEYDVFALNRPENKIIKSTLLFLQKYNCCSQNLKNIVQLLKFFSDVSPSKNYEDDFLKCRFERGMTGYADVLNICRAFLGGNSFNVFAGDNNLSALLFPMELLFESYIAKILKKSFMGTEYEISVQEQGVYLFDTPQKFRLRPDIVIKHNNSMVVLDTKWKLLTSSGGKKNGISQQDIYQMYAYAKRYSAKQVILLYPYSDNCEQQCIEYHTDVESVCVKVMFVDLTKEDDIVDEVVAHVKNILI